MMKYAFYYAQFHDVDDTSRPLGLFIQLGIMTGLLMMIYSKLKIEDEMSKHLRLVSLQWAIFLYILFRVCFKSIAFYKNDPQYLPKNQANFLLLLYLILFYSQVYFIPWLQSKFTKNED